MRRLSDQMSESSCHCWGKQKNVGRLHPTSSSSLWEQVITHHLRKDAPWARHCTVGKMTNCILNKLFPSCRQFLIIDTTPTFHSPSWWLINLFFRHLHRGLCLQYVPSRHTDRCVWTLYEFWLGLSERRPPKPPNAPFSQGQLVARATGAIAM